MSNPYQSPSSDAEFQPLVEVVRRAQWAARNFEQIYRFESPIADASALRHAIVDYYLGHKCQPISSSGENLEFERIYQSRLWQLVSSSERKRPQSISISLERTPQGQRVTCHYCVRTLLPTLLLPPHQLEVEVRQLALLCGQACAPSLDQSGIALKSPPFIRSLLWTLSSIFAIPAFDLAMIIAIRYTFPRVLRTEVLKYYSIGFPALVMLAAFLLVSQRRVGLAGGILIAICVTLVVLANFGFYCVVTSPR